VYSEESNFEMLMAHRKPEIFAASFDRSTNPNECQESASTYATDAFSPVLAAHYHILVSIDNK
jgi:hypothetical protein